MPRTPFIGVRSSWLTLATKSDFMREASCAPRSRASLQQVGLGQAAAFAIAPVELHHAAGGHGANDPDAAEHDERAGESGVVDIGAPAGIGAPPDDDGRQDGRGEESPRHDPRRGVAQEDGDHAAIGSRRQDGEAQDHQPGDGGRSEPGRHEKREKDLRMQEKPDQREKADGQSAEGEELARDGTARPRADKHQGDDVEQEGRRRIRRHAIKAQMRRDQLEDDFLGIEAEQILQELTDDQ